MKNFYFVLFIIFFLSCKKNEIDIRSKACFQLDSDSILKIGDTLRFSNCSENADSYLWNFGDSTNSLEPCPVHVYKKSGIYKIKLKATNGNYIDTISKTVTIIDQYLTHLDTTIENIFGLLYPFYLDFDHDKINDVSIGIDYRESHFGGNSAFSRGVYISPLNGFEVNIFKNPIDSYIQVQKHTIDDSIKIEETYSMENRSLNSYYSSAQEKTINNYWMSDDYYYITFRKKVNDGYILAWLKIKVPNYSRFSIKEYKYYPTYKNVKISD